MTTLKPYPTYCDTGIEWLERFPSHWEATKLKNVVARIVSGGTPESGNSLYWDQPPGGIPFVMIGDMTQGPFVESTSRAITNAGLESRRLELVPSGALVYSMYASVGFVSELTFPAVINQALLGLVVERNAVCITFLRYWLGSLRDFVRQLASSSTQANINLELVKNLPVVRPPLDEQRAIADFLDAMDARITRFVAARKKMIRLLEEKKQAAINQAVTRGLDPTVPMKDSGVDWLGEIPAHWGVRRLRSCIVDSLAGIWGDEPSAENVDDHVWCIRVADFDMDSLRITDRKKTMRAVPISARKHRLLQVGDLLLEKSGGGENQPVGRVVLFDWDEQAVSSNFVTRLRPDRTVVRPSYLLALMEAMQAARITQLSIKQTTGIQNLDERHYLSNTVPAPSIEEQDRIVAQIARETSRIDTLRTRSEREIELIQEYRTRLISDVVTGKLDVRGVDLGELPEFEEVPEPGDNSEVLGYSETLDVDERPTATEA